MELNDFPAYFASLPDHKLAEVICNQADYRPEVYEIAREEFDRRGIPLELAEDVSIIQLEASEEITLANAQKVGNFAKIVFFLFPIVGLADLGAGLADQKIPKGSPRIFDTLMFSGLGAGLWFILYLVRKLFF
ncbi:MAG: hypothetical protein H6581_12415 [Bacteroidia bacterium]|nr:hypothetical protein [Bacteroidia bacterium]